MEKGVRVVKYSDAFLLYYGIFKILNKFTYIIYFLRCL